MAEPVPFDFNEYGSNLQNPGLISQIIAQRDNELFDSTGFIQASLKINQYIKDNSDEKVFCEAYSQIGQEVSEESKETQYVIDNIDKIDFSKVGGKIKDLLKNDLDEIKALHSDYNQKKKSFEVLDVYKQRATQELLAPDTETGKEFLDALSKHIESVISSKILDDSKDVFKDKLVDFLQKYERFKVIKNQEESFGVCALCMDHSVNITFQPCHHCCCEGCFNLFNLGGKCPLCRGSVTGHHKIYL